MEEIIVDPTDQFASADSQEALSMQMQPTQPKRNRGRPKSFVKIETPEIKKPQAPRSPSRDRVLPDAKWLADFLRRLLEP